MTFDYGSVLLAVGASGAALCFTLFTNWLRQRGSGFLMTWTLAMGIVVLSVAAFVLFDVTGLAALGAGGCILLITAITIHYGGLVQFRDGALPTRTVVVLSSAMALPLAIAFGLGFDGLGFWLINGLCAGLIFYCGVEYWRMRAESPASIMTIAVLHHALAVTFVLCLVVGIQESPLYLVNGSPQNWAELVNLVVSVIALTGIGGLLVTVHQERISRQHQHNALTDPLTGLSNRRALFDLYEGETVPENTAIIVLDLDEFKVLNDTYGHAVGDAVLQNFGGLLTSLIEPRDLAIRLGGEEFVIVLPDRSDMEAMAVAERIRAATAGFIHDVRGQTVRCTVSAGVAVADKPGRSLDTLLRRADNALYLSKRNGRNQVTAPDTQAA
jgi:diguanylate cyclase (GGDEF)-like protein